MLSRATQRASSTCRPSVPNSTSNPPGRLHVERDHLVVHVAAERRRQRRLVLAHPLERAADVVELVDLEHDVHALARVRHRQERQAVVARVHAEEAQPDLRAGLLADELARHAHRVAQPEAEHVGVEPQRLDVVDHRDHDVAHALVAGDELRGVRRDDRPGLVGDAVEQLEDVVERVGEPDQLLDPALGELLGRALLELDTGLLRCSRASCRAGWSASSQPTQSSWSTSAGKTTMRAETSSMRK